MTADIPAIEARAAAATPGPWQTALYPDGKTGVFVGHLGTHPVAISDLRKDADFIAHAPTDIRALLADLAAERELSKTLRTYVECVHDDDARCEHWDAARTALTAYEEAHR